MPPAPTPPSPWKTLAWQIRISDEWIDFRHAEKTAGGDPAGLLRQLIRWCRAGPARAAHRESGISPVLLIAMRLFAGRILR